MIAEVAMSQLEVQLTNRIVTMQCCVRMDNFRETVHKQPDIALKKQEIAK